ncbi:MAG: hypothetical protein V3U54_06775 [Thermodesulfobacteriota bacterium]
MKKLLILISILLLTGCCGLQTYRPMGQMTTEEIYQEFKWWENKFINGPYFALIQFEEDIMRHADLGMELSKRGYWPNPSLFSYDTAVP